MSPVTTSYEKTERRITQILTRDSEGLSLERNFIVHHPFAEDILLSNTLPAHGEQHPTISYLRVSKVEVRPMSEANECEARVTYTEDPLDVTPNGETWEWDIATSSQKITSVKNETLQSHYPDYENTGTAIGHDGEKAEGVSVLRPSMSLKVTKKWDTFTRQHQRFLETTVACVNNAEWYGYTTGEVLYLGSNVAMQTTGVWLITYNFKIERYVSEPQEIELYNGEFVQIYPEPHDYVWFTHTKTRKSGGESIGDTTSTMKNGTRGIHIAKVYDYADFGGFGLLGPYYA